MIASLTFKHLDNILIGAYYMHIMSNINGIDLENLEKKEMRSGAYSTMVPAVR